MEKRLFIDAEAGVGITDTLTEDNRCFACRNNIVGKVMQDGKIWKCNCSISVHKAYCPLCYDYVEVKISKTIALLMKKVSGFHA